MEVIHAESKVRELGQAIKLYHSVATRLRTSLASATVPGIQQSLVLEIKRADEKVRDLFQATRYFNGIKLRHRTSLEAFNLQTAYLLRYIDDAGLFECLFGTSSTSYTSCSPPTEDEVPELDSRSSQQSSTSCASSANGGLWFVVTFSLALPPGSDQPDRFLFFYRISFEYAI